MYLMCCPCGQPGTRFTTWKALAKHIEAEHIQKKKDYDVISLVFNYLKAGATDAWIKRKLNLSDVELNYIKHTHLAKRYDLL
jgi:hypothetical protein